ncbi:MAG: hypothetical protein ABIR55_04915 [Burkholderiaceae bacterium]
MSTRYGIPTARRALASACAGLLFAAAGVTPALAVQVDTPTKFELDANARDSNALATLPDDWDGVFNLYGATGGVAVAGAGETFVIDSQNGEAGFSGQSNKDIDEVNTWIYDNAKVTPDKDNITNAYAKAYTIDGHLVVYFGADRLSNSGDAALGFWFFRNSVGLGPKSGRSGPFTGTHAVGDVLVQVDYFNGGSQSRIEIFKWVASGGDVSTHLQRVGVPATSNGTTVCNALHTACATSNAGNTPSPWAYSPKSGAANVFPYTSFFEAGIDVTELIGEVCFSSFMAETRTSHSETAELKDFALGDFDLCSIDVEKTCVLQGTEPAIFNPANETFQTKHNVRIENNGYGPLYGVQIQDNAIIAGSKDCAISTITGGIDPPGTNGGILLANNTAWTTVADQLNPGAANAMTVSLIYITSDNPFVNQVSVRSKASPTSAVADVTDQDTETTAEADVCQLTLGVGLALTKYCHGDTHNPNFKTGDLSVLLDSSNGYKPKVCVDIKLQSTTPDQRQVITSFTDTDLGNLIGNVPLVGGQRILEPQGTSGDSVTVSQCYSPAVPDNGQTDPHKAQFTDTVNAAGRGKTFPTTSSAGPTSATCDMCD